MEVLRGWQARLPRGRLSSAAPGRASSAAAAARRSSRSSSTRSSPRRARRSSSTSSGSTSSARRCCASATTSSGAATSRRSSRQRRSGARASRSPRPAPTSPSLRTRAVEHDDHFVLSGQKTWVSWGQYARWCGVLARTDESGRRTHRGISMLIVDMRSPGVEVRPDDADHRPRRVLRAVPRRRRRPQGEPARRARRRAGRSPCTRSATSAAPPRCRARSSCARGSTARCASPPSAQLDGAAAAR